MSRRRFFMVCVIVTGSFGTVRADQFETLDGPVLAKFMAGKGSEPLTKLSTSELGVLPILLKDSRSALLIVKTAQGNDTRLLATPELRKPLDGKGQPFPVFVLERFDTYDGGNAGSRVARGREIILFDGFQVDLDTAQVVPEGQGGDLRFVIAGEGGPRLEAIGDSKIFTPRVLPVPEAGAAPQPTPGRRVIPTDFSGRYRLFANGQWSGLLELKADTKGEIVGNFRSDLHGSSYNVTGQVASDSPQRVRFAVKFPRSQQDFDGYLWSEGKGAMAGTVSLLEQNFGFFAIREGGKVAPETEIGPVEGNPAETTVVKLDGRGIKLGDKTMTTLELEAAIRGLAPSEVLIRASDEVPFKSVEAAIATCRVAGVGVVRLGRLDSGQK